MTPTDKNNEPLDAVLRRAMRAEPGPATPECADAESLAAYSDRSLAAAHRERLEAHFADCMRCQMLLADIARADESARSAKGADAVPWYRRWRVAIPALAAAAAVLVFIAIRRPANEEQRSDQLVAMAKNEAPRMEVAEQAAAPAPSAQMFAPASPAAAPASAPAAKAAAPAASSSNQLAMNETRAEEKAKEASRAHHAARAPAVAPASPPVEAGRVVAIAPAAPVVNQVPRRVGQSAPISGGLAMNQPQPESAQLAESTGYAGRQVRGSAALSGNRGLVGAPGGAAPAIAGAAEGESETAVVGYGAAGVGSSAVIGGRPAGSFSASRVSASEMGIVTIPTPDHNVWWIAGKDGMLQRHNPDSRIHLQRSGVTTDLVAGAAPSSTVCWIVGRSGTIIRTTDGGEHWELIAAPNGDNLTRVSASSAKDATITTSSGKSFATSDGGASWRLQ